VKLEKGVEGRVGLGVRSLVLKLFGEGEVRTLTNQSTCVAPLCPRPLTKFRRENFEEEKKKRDPLPLTRREEGGMGG